MAARKEKSEEDLILEDKIDLARTLVRLKARQTIRRELNELESKIVEQHTGEVRARDVTRVTLDPGSVVHQALDSPS